VSWPGGKKLRSGDARHPWGVRRGADDLGERGLVGGSVDGCHQLQRPAEAGPEALDEHLVPPVGGGRGAGGVGAVVSRSLAHREERHAEGDQGGQRADGVHDAVRLDPLGPAQPPARGLGNVGLAAGQRGALTTGQGPLADDPDQRGQQRLRGHHREQHRDGRGDGRPGQHADADGKHPEQGDAHGDPGEHDRPSRGARGGDDGVLHAEPAADPAADAGQDEQ